MKTAEYIDLHVDEMKAVLARLIKHKSVSAAADGKYPFGRECGDVLDEFMAICGELGFQARNYDYYAASADLDEKKAELGILAHLDVVPASEKDWSYPPFEMTDAGEKLFGRGCIDDKGAVAAALLAMKSVRECGVLLKRGVRLIVGCSEETGTLEDINYYRRKSEIPPMTFTPDGDFPVITAEKGIFRITFGGSFGFSRIEKISGGTVINAVPADAEAVIAGEAVNVHGAAAHASTPELGDNAITRLMQTLADRLTGEDARVIGAIGRLFPHEDYHGSALGFDNAELTCALTLISADSEKISCSCDMRYPEGMKPEEMSEVVRRALEGGGLELLKTDYNLPHAVDGQSGFVKTLLSVYHDVTGLEPYCKTIGGQTYVHGIKCGVAFGMEFPGENNNMHSADEFVLLDSLVRSAKIYAEAIERICS